MLKFAKDLSILFIIACCVFSVIFLLDEIKNREQQIITQTETMDKNVQYREKLLEQYGESILASLGKEYDKEYHEEIIREHQSARNNLYICVSMVSLLTVLAILPYLIPLLQKQIIPFFKRRYCKQKKQSE